MSILNPIKLASSIIGGSVMAILRQQSELSRQRTIQGLRQKSSGSYSPSDVDAYKLGIPISTRLQEVYTFQADVTQYAVEDGAIFSDHVILRPIRVDLGFEVSNWNGSEDARSAIMAFVDRLESREVVTLITEHLRLPNMVCVSILADNSMPAWGKLAFRACFQQVKRVTIGTARYNPDNVLGAPARTSQLPAPAGETGGPSTGGSVVPPKNVGIKPIKRVQSRASGMFDKSILGYGR